MVSIKYKETGYNRDAVWQCPHCKKELRFNHSVPYNCQGCRAKLPSIHLLIPFRNQSDRVKFFMEGKV